MSLHRTYLIQEFATDIVKLMALEEVFWKKAKKAEASGSPQGARLMRDAANAMSQARGDLLSAANKEALDHAPRPLPTSPRLRQAIRRVGLPSLPSPRHPR